MSLYIWKGYRRFFGRYISHEQYILSKKSLTRVKGIIFKKEKCIPLYKVKEVHLSQSFLQRRWNVGTISCSLRGADDFLVKNVQDPYRVEKLISKAVKDSDSHAWNFVMSL